MLSLTKGFSVTRKLSKARKQHTRRLEVPTNCVWDLETKISVTESSLKTLLLKKVVDVN